MLKSTISRLEKVVNNGSTTTLEEPDQFGLHLILERNALDHQYHIPAIAPFHSANLVSLYREFDKTSTYAFFKHIVRFYKFLFPKASSFPLLQRFSWLTPLTY